jgi:hypothetical protein
MSSWVRLWLGCIFGALLVLFIHPVSRGFLLAGLFPLRDSRVLRTTQYFPENIAQIAISEDSLQLSYLIQVLSGQLLNREALGGDQQAKLTEVISKKNALDPRNSLWSQFLATQMIESAPETAARIWIDGSERGAWNDFQSARFEKVNQELQGEFGARMAWQASAISLRRSIVIQQLVQRTARELVSRNPSLLVRLATVKHGIMLTNSSRSVDGGAIGIAVIYIGASGDSTPIIGSPGARADYRKSFLAELTEADMTEERDRLVREFREIESWSNLVQSESNREWRWTHHFSTVLTSALPGAFILSSLFGFALVGLGLIFTKLEVTTDKALSLPVAPILGLTLGLSVYALTGLFWLTMWSVLSISFFIFRSNKLRSNPPDGLTGWHRGLIILLGVLLIFPTTAFFIGLSPSGRSLLPALGIPDQFCSGSAFFLGLVLFLMSFAAFSAALWGLIDRRSPIPLLQIIHKELGLAFAGVMITLAVLVTPFCIYADRAGAELSSRFMQNEPNIYFTR